MKKYHYKDAKRMVQIICKAAAEGAFDTREKFLAALDKNPDIAAQGYNAFGKIFFWNEASCKTYGYSEAAAVNQDLIELILPPDLQRFARDMIAAARKTGKTPEAGPCDLVRRGGGLVTVYSGHLMFQWGNSTTPEFYCIDVVIDPDSV